MTLVESGTEYQTDAGRIDLLARDVNKNLVVVELKASKAKDSALGQLLGDVGCLSEAKRARYCSGFELRFAGNLCGDGLSNVKLVRYQLSFSLEEVS